VRIIGGQWAGRDLVSPSGRVRPTAEAVRDALLRRLQPDLQGADVLDLFAGTGALGLEALSRGAARCDFVENGAAAIHALRANVAALGVKTRTRIFLRDAIPFVDRVDRPAWDVALADPPWGSRKLDRIVDRWTRTPFSRVLGLIHAADHPTRVPGRSKRVDSAMVTVLRLASRG